jgi:hypothetical protein
MSRQTKTKNPSKRLTKAEQEILVAWLKHHDREFYGDKLKYKSAKVRAKIDLGLEKNFLQLARDTCEFWMKKKIRTRRTARRIAFDGREWEKINRWTREHRNEINPTLDTKESVCRRMREAGVLCVPSAVHESLLLLKLDLSKNPPKFKQPADASSGSSPVLRQYA